MYTHTILWFSQYLISRALYTQNFLFFQLIFTTEIVNLLHYIFSAVFVCFVWFSTTLFQVLFHILIDNVE